MQSWYPHAGQQLKFCSRGEREVLFGGAAGPGKMQPLGSLVATPFGFRPMAEIKPGSVVTNPSGGQSKVILVFDFEGRDTYRFTFSDGTCCEAGDEHLWLAWIPRQRTKRRILHGSEIYPGKSRVFTTLQLLDLLNKGIRAIVPLTKPVAFAPGRRKAKIDPYLLGVLLGDGSLSAVDHGQIRLSNIDQQILKAVENRFDGQLSGDYKEYCLSGCPVLRESLREYGLNGTRSHDKFIPKQYQRLSVAERFELIQGLFDTDGSADSRDGHVEYSTVSKQLCRDVSFMLRGLGFKVRISNKKGSYLKDGKRHYCRNVYRLSVQGRDKELLFALTRKRNKCRQFNGGNSIPGKRIEKIEYAGKQDSRCIRVDHPNGLYLTDDFTVTHNTDCLIMEAARFIRFPDYRGIIFRRTFPRLEEIIDRCHEYYPVMGGDYRTGENRWTFPSGAKVKLSHMQHEGDKRNSQGKEYQFIGYDELTEFLESQYLYLLSRLRSTNPSIPRRIRATTNPGGIGHMWVKKRFVDIGPAERTFIDPATGMSRCFIPATVYDNPTLFENDPEYIQMLKALPEVERKRLLYGIWDVFEGQVFTELSQRVHGCEDFVVPPEWEKFMVFDWGYSRPWAAFWFAVDFDGVMYLYREHYGAKKDDQGKIDPNEGLRQTNNEICEVIHSLEREKIRFRVADPACWGPTKLRGRNDMLGPSFAEDAGKAGLHFTRADNDRIRGIQQCHMRLRVEQYEKNGETIERPVFVAFNSCARWWEEMQSIYADPKNPEDVDTDQPDEGVDCFRYACMARPIIPKIKNKVPPGSFMAERAKYIRAKKYAQRHGVSLAAAYVRVR